MRRPWLFLIVLVWSAHAWPAEGDEPGWFDLRTANLLVTPSTGPVTHLVVKNRGTGTLTGRVEASFPEGWRVEPTAFDLTLAAGETRPLALTIKKARDRADNLYPVALRWSAGGKRGTQDQTMVCASAPFFKPKIDGDLAEWADAIPITLTGAGCKTVLRSYWNTKQFCVAVEVEEARLAPWRGGGKPCDAVQFALSAADAAGSARHEFLLAATAGLFARPHCYTLFKPGDDPAAGPQHRDLKPLRLKEAEVAVRRKGGVTRYEAAIPWSLITEIKADAGREFQFSLLVHDPDGTGLRDFGAVLNRWPEDRRPDGWSSWNGVAWGDKVPFDSLARFGFCSSIH